LNQPVLRSAAAVSRSTSNIPSASCGDTDLCGQPLVVVDALLTQIPITPRELEALEHYCEDLIIELFAPSCASPPAKPDAVTVNEANPKRSLHNDEAT
jgi:hypothetical protein